MKASGGPKIKLNCRTLRSVRNKYNDWRDLYKPKPGQQQTSKRKTTAEELGITAAQIAYQNYLESEHWRETRANALIRAKYQCERCGSKIQPLHVHHLTYKNKGNEHPLDLVVLCKFCHAEQHGKPVGSNVPVTRTAFNRSGHVEALGTRVVCGCGPSLNTSLPKETSGTTPSRLSQ
jgi:5-methylcytosine-specific restriction endonuclease McrA